MAQTFVEGLPCAGKSLMVKDFEAQGHDVVHELGRVIEPGQFPGNGKTVDEILKIDEWFIEQERLRLREQGIFDRSYFTHLAYSYAYSQLEDLPSFRPTVQRYETAITNGDLPLPNTIAYIDIEPRESIVRQQIRVRMGRRALDAFWSDQEFLTNMRYAYSSLLENCNGIGIVTIDGQLDTSSKTKALVEVGSDFGDLLERGVDLDNYIIAMEKRKCSS